MRASTLHIRRPGSSATPWWSRRPWADQFAIVDTSAYLPGRHHAAPLLEPSPRKRARSLRPQDSVWHRPAQAADRRGLGAFASIRRSLQLPVSLQVVTPEEAARLDDARSRIAFRPRNGFLHSTPIGSLLARQEHGD
ncbi:MAG TPA: hypothetical protein VNS57_02010 [Steroidobacteraceae bacterium]|nr:hypothetical protein [Steroidobacteraceae bacterium]